MEGERNVATMKVLISAAPAAGGQPRVAAMELVRSGRFFSKPNHQKLSGKKRPRSSGFANCKTKASPRTTDTNMITFTQFAHSWDNLELPLHFLAVEFKLGGVKARTWS